MYARENDNNSGRPLRLKKRTSIISIVTAGRLAHFSNVYSLRTIIIITRLPGHYPASSSKSPNTSGSKLTNDGRSRITHKKQALPCSHESAESLTHSVSQATPLVFVYYFRNVLFGLFDPHHDHHHAHAREVRLIRLPSDSIADRGHISLIINRYYAICTDK